MNPVRKELREPLFVGLLQQNEQNSQKTEGLPSRHCLTTTTVKTAPICVLINKNEPETNISGSLIFTALHET